MHLPKVISVLILCSALLAIMFNFLEYKWAFILFKPLTAIAIIAYIWISVKGVWTRYQKLTFIALAWCCLGDILLLDRSLFLFGLIAFLIGHLFLIGSFVAKNGWLNFTNPGLALVIYGGCFSAFLFPHLGNMRIPVTCYVVVIMLMVWQGVNSYLLKPSPDHRYILIGVVFFMVSDSILAVDLFYQSFPTSGIWVLSTYWGALFLIAKACTLVRIPSSLNA